MAPEQASLEATKLRAGIVSGFGAYLIWGLLTFYWKELAEFNAFELIGWRIVAATVILLVVIAVTGRGAPVWATFRSPGLLWRVALAAVLLSNNWTLYVYSVVSEQIMESALGYFIAPLLTSLIGVVALREPLRRPQKAALTLAAVAVVFLTVGYGRPPYIALGLAFTWAIYGLLKKRVPLGPLESLTTETLVLAPVALVIVIIGAMQPTGVVATAGTDDWIFLSFAGIITAVPLLLFARAALRLPLTVLGPLQYLVPTINFLLGWLVYDEPLDRVRIVGFLLVWIALFITIGDSLRARRNAVEISQTGT